MRGGLHFEDFKHRFHNEYRVKLFQDDFGLFFFEELVVEKVIDEVQQESGL